jgi:hypothetical protein
MDRQRRIPAFEDEKETHIIGIRKAPDAVEYSLQPADLRATLANFSGKLWLGILNLFR